MKHPLLTVCVPVIVLVLVLMALVPATPHPDFLSPSAIAVDAAGSSLSGSGGYRRIRWNELVPARWNPKAVFRGQDVSSWSDADPRALALQQQMKTVWDGAPVNEALDGQAIRTAGYVVPVEESGDGMREFLLVPYFGSCIHTPPPPANQIIDVSLSNPVEGLHSMDAVWVSGVLRVARVHHDIGDSSYALRADDVAHYREASQ